MSDSCFLLDTHVVVRLTPAERATELFLRCCRVPSDVIHESGPAVPASDLRPVEYRTTPGVLRWLVKVMASVAVGDTRLVDLYANKGAADPVLIACALDATDRTAGELFAPTWSVVSHDGALGQLARAFGVHVCSPDEFFQHAQAAVAELPAQLRAFD